MTEQGAREMSAAWTELALALQEPQPKEARGIESAPGAPMELALEMMMKILKSPEREDHNYHNRMENGDKEFASRRRALERAARAMGFSSDGIDALWAVALDLLVCQEPNEYSQAELVKRWMQANDKTPFSEALAWSACESLALEALKLACQVEWPVFRFARAGDLSREALSRLDSVCAELGGEGERGWMGEREARIAKAMLATVEALARHDLDDRSESKEAKKNAEAFVEKSGRLGALIEASESAAKAMARSRSNVKQRRIGAG